MNINLLRVMAFRYALGRQTYVVSEMVRELISHWGEILEYQCLILRDIKEAISSGRAGSEYDVHQWERVLALEEK